MFLSPSLIRNYTLEMHPLFLEKILKFLIFYFEHKSGNGIQFVFEEFYIRKNALHLLELRKQKWGVFFQKNFKKIVFSTFSTNPRCNFVYLLKRLTTEKILFTCYNWEAKNVSLFLKK